MIDQYNGVNKEERKNFDQTKYVSIRNIFLHES